MQRIKEILQRRIQSRELYLDCPQREKIWQARFAEEQRVDQLLSAMTVTERDEFAEEYLSGGEMLELKKLYRANLKPANKAHAHELFLECIVQMAGIHLERSLAIKYKCVEFPGCIYCQTGLEIAAREIWNYAMGSSKTDT